MSVQIKHYSAPPVDRHAILHYAGVVQAEALTEQIDLLLLEIESRLTYRVCYRTIEVSVVGDVCDFGFFSLTSPDLAQNLRGCSRVVLFAATIGVEMDRLQARYSRISPAKALLLQAIGTERIEALCDLFCADIAGELGACRPRFSPGYGTVPLAVQKEFFKLLECEKRLGICLTDSLLMIPTKTVTAFIGVVGE